MGTAKMGKLTKKAAIEKQFANIDKEIFNQVFKILSSEDSFYQAIQMILEEICRYYSLDRGVLLEADKRDKRVSITARWTREDDGNDPEKIKESATRNWYYMEKYYGSLDYNILSGGKDEREDYSEDVYAQTKIPVSAVQFPIWDGSRMAGVFTFENWTKREWNQTETATLFCIARMISSHLLKRQMQDELEKEYLIGKKAMDMQKLVYYVIDKETYRLQYVSRYAQESNPQAQYGRLCYEAVMGKDAPCRVCPLKECKKDGKSSTVEYYDVEEDDWYTLIASYADMEPDSKNVVVGKTNITDFLNRVKGEDQLMGIMSYERFRTEAVRKLKRGELSTLVFLGIQDFSRINDEYGYEVGDEVLRLFAKEVDKRLEEGELFCRIKGDDFAALISPMRFEKDMYKIMGDISWSITAAFRAKCPNISIECFAGAYVISKPEEYFSRCLDKAMKARKMACKNWYETGGVYVYTKEFELQEKEKRAMSRTMKDSLKKGHFRVFFQPKVNILTGKIVGAEALVRLQGEDGRLIPPGKFIPLAEENGMIVEIDEFVYEETFRLMRQWLDEGKEIPLISVNLSRVHLLNDRLPSIVRGMSDKHHLRPEQIELEITESIFFEDTERMIEMIKQLKEMGYVISMDDFGAGFSTLNLLKSMPVDVIKLDGGFFLHNELDDKNKAVISAIMRLAENLGFETVSEGVETKEQVEFIKEQGSKCVQGYYFYKPMPAEEFKELL